MKHHFMIDLETMGIRPSSAIVSIGIVQFDQTSVVDKFYTNVSLADGLAHGLTQDQSTIDWWAGQPAEIRAAWQRDDAPLLLPAMKSVQDYLLGSGPVGSVCVWGNGVDVDAVVLKASFEALGASEPWKFYNQYCFRTMKNMFTGAESVPRSGAHHALADAEYQVACLHRIMAIHKLNLP